MDPTGVFGALLQRLERISNNHGNNQQAALRQTGDKLLERFRALRPDNFDGAGEAWQAEQWLREMDHIFETIECTESDKRRMATFQLTFAAVDWWEAEKAIIGNVAACTMTWTMFLERFLEKFFPEDEKDQK